MTTYAEARTACHLPPLEVQFNSIVAGLLFAEQRLDGSIVDAGAREGHNACFYAVIAPTRTVHAIEPIRANYRIINKLYSGRSNLRPLLAGLGSAHGAIDLVGGRPGAMLDKKKMETCSSATGRSCQPRRTCPRLPSWSRSIASSRRGTRPTWSTRCAAPDGIAATSCTCRGRDSSSTAARRRSTSRSRRARSSPAMRRTLWRTLARTARRSREGGICTLPARWALGF